MSLKCAFLETRLLASNIFRYSLHERCHAEPARNRCG